MTHIDYLMIACATWYVTFCLTALPGPRGIFTIMRNHAGIMQCKYCLSLWIGIVFYSFAYCGYTDIVNVFGLVGGGHLLAAFTGVDYSIEIPDDEDSIEIPDDEDS